MTSYYTSRVVNSLDQLLYARYLSARGSKATNNASRAFNYLTIGSVFCSSLLRRSKVLGLRGEHLITNVWPGWHLLGNNCRDSLKAYPSPVRISLSRLQSYFLHLTAGWKPLLGRCSWPKPCRDAYVGDSLRGSIEVLVNAAHLASLNL
jgi:hypothetical protein